MPCSRRKATSSIPRTCVSRARPPSQPRRGATLGEAEAKLVAAALEQHGWNLARTARTLGISRNTLKGRIEKWGLARPPDTGKER